LVAVASSCSAEGGGQATSIAPLPTTGVPVIDTIPSEDVSYTPEEFAFFDDVVYYYGGMTPMDDATMIGFAEVWCGLMVDGMGDTDVVERINEGATDGADRRTHFAIVLSGIRNICPSQSDKAEYIAMNAPLP
jgi:hypothetical protein